VGSSPGLGERRPRLTLAYNRPVRIAVLRSLCLAALGLLPLCAVAQAPSAASPPVQTPPAPDPRAPSTKAMAALLAQIFAAQDWKTDPDKQPERIRYYEALLESGHLDPVKQAQVRQALAEQMLEDGDSRGAIRQLETVRTLAQANRIRLEPPAVQALHASLGLAYLRLGEQENCQMRHASSSCIFPLRGNAIHHMTEGAEGAVREFTAALEADPDDLASQWLLNLAYMQLGQYPAGVPPRWLVPESRFASEAPLQRFPDVAPEAGVAVTGHSGGVVMEDLDGDGLLDLMISSSGPGDQLRFFHNNGDGTFSDRTRAAGLEGETGGLNLICADFDNDGHPDVLVLRGAWWGAHGNYPVSLLRNRGDGTFEDVSVHAGLMTLGPTQSAAWADYDNDGWLDLFIGRESTPGNPQHSQLLHNNHDGTFTDVAAASGLDDLGFVKGVAWGDYNNDRRPDLYVSIKGRPNRLFRNDGPGSRPGQWRFTDVTARAGVSAPVESFPTWFFDYDNDGWPDLFVGGYSSGSPRDVAAFEMGKPFDAETPRLYHNNHDGTFSDVTARTHLNRAILPMGASFGDLDNDGWLDVYLGTGDSLYTSLLPNRMFRNDRGRVFQDVTTAGGFGHLQKGHSVAFGDLENSGNEDVFEEMGGALPGDTFESVLYRNPGGANHWLSLDLEGVRTNRSAIGARIDVAVREAGALRHIYRTVGYGSSFGGNPLRQHIGIGAATAIDSIEVRWPAGLDQHFQRVVADRAYRLREGGALRPAGYPRFHLPIPPD
jgi:hypothetical protein